MDALFSRIARRYDRMNRIMSLSLDSRWRRAALESCRIPEGVRALDLACGTGDFTMEILRRDADALVTAIDITGEMIEIAKGKLSGRPGVRFVVADACDLGMFGDRSFDLVTCAFGFRNFHDRERALAECFRVLSPGGELAVLEFFRPGSWIAGAAVGAWLRAVSFAFAHGARREYACLRRSISGMVDADGFAAEARDAGFAEIRRRRLLPAATAIVFEKPVSARA